MDCELTPEGRSQVEIQRDYLQSYDFTRIVCSPLKRCLQTSKILGFAEKMNIDPDIREIDFGHFEGQTFSAVQEKYPDHVRQWCVDEDSFTFPQGGSRSGKSSYAQKWAEELGAEEKIFVATSPHLDEEMSERIARHRLEREGRGWDTVEEQRDISRVIEQSHGADVLLIDCLTLWVNNILYTAEQRGEQFSEDAMLAHCEDVIRSAQAHPGTLLFVSNEVGSGIIPGNQQTRLYRDLVGRCNQVFAQGAHEVVLVTCGLPQVLKKAVSP
ncbi:unnamed protein product [Cyprideis torosa]|uniref:Adenosylcobinamide kinase n=1 Tax=Cyprideis torosa TaxID=163714 RepID=A0A7R8WQL3_9CRUS|nr:unnamed protein product [Cyprideis torosa]CAG0908024.1 unnamed protein product [Cyprideis torosa]